MYRGGGITPRAVRTGSGVGGGELTVVTTGVAGVADSAGVGVGFWPNAEQASMNVMIVNCLAVLTNSLNEYIWVPRKRSLTAVTGGESARAERLDEFWHRRFLKTSGRWFSLIVTRASGA
jgi:hypothetical protein